ncbi:MAG: hypothetical protein ACI91Q_001059 [Gammaproteobacteria bacterium]|jgi:hypothetical protein
MCSVLAVDGEFDERSAQPPARGAGGGGGQFGLGTSVHEGGDALARRC